MWRWLVVAALVYGLMMTAAIIAPRSLLAVGALDLAAFSEAWQESGTAPQLHEFEQPAPPPFTLPESPAQVVELDEGNHVLSWQPPPDAPVSFLGLPASTGDPPPHAVTVRLRAEGVQLLVIGVREDDGSVYASVLPATPEWQYHNRPLQRLELSERTVDENGVLDVEQITAVFIAVKPLAPSGRRGNRRPFDAGLPPPLVELDGFGLVPPRLDGLGPPAGMEPPPDQWQPGFGPPDGRRDSRPLPENQPPAPRREGRPPPG